VFEVRPIGVVVSSLTSLVGAPKQGDETAPDAWLVLNESVRPALADVTAGDELVVLTWLHAADRDVLVVRPRGDPERRLTGVFSTRSPARPNPIGLHPVRVLEVDGLRVHVDALEALDGTPIIDVKSDLGSPRQR
jgi:tRNA-Thr(GGU) m(6)t(6)A37 methyltransferase TsaA